jgi:hypothetical protein
MRARGNEFIGICHPKRGGAPLPGWLCRLLLCVALIVGCIRLTGGQADAAQITVSSAGEGPALIVIRGELTLVDASKFLRKTQGITDAVVLLQSAGGNAFAGIMIGKAIRQRGFLTAVPAAVNCASACALAWLAGTPRFMAKNSQIGFHAAYFMKGGKPRQSAAATGIVRGYLKQLGMPKQAVTYLSSAPPDKLYWLSIDATRALGINVGVYTPEGITSSLGRAPPVAKATPAPEAAPVSEPETTASITPPPADTASAIAPAGEPSAIGAEIRRAPMLDLMGQDLPGMPIREADASSCETRCRDDGECKAFTYNEEYSACFLKSRVDFAFGDRSASSGYRAELEPQIRRLGITIEEATDFPGNDYDWRKPATFSSCLLACSDNAVCRAFTFIASRQECWLKNAVGSGEPRPGLVSGVK